MTRARTVAEVIAGEAVSGTPEQRMADMMAIASVISNRAQQLGVSMQDIVSAPTQNGYEFSAYNHPLPAGVDQSIIDMAQQAIDSVAENGPVTSATFYATPNAVEGLPNNLSFETSTTGHEYFSDPLGRSINTAQGLRIPNAYAYAANIEDAPIPALNPSAIPTQNPAFLAGAPLSDVDPNMALAVPDAVTNLPAPDLATAQNFQTPAAPTVESWSQMAAARPVQAPMGSVTADSDLVATAPQEAATKVAAVPDVATVSSRMGLAEPGFDQSRFDGGGVSVANGFDPGRFGNPASVANASSLASGVMAQRDYVDPAGPGVMAGIDTSSFDASRFGPDVASFDQSRFGPISTAEFDQARLGPALVDPATNVASFVDQPADLGSMPDAYAAQRGPSTGINSAEMSERLADIERQKLNPSLQAPAVKTAAVPTAQDSVLSGIPGLSVPAQAVPDVGVMAGIPNFTQAMNPSLPSLASTPVDPNPVQVAEINQAAQIPGVIAAKMAPAAVTAYADEPATPPAVAAIEDQTNVPAQTTSSSALLSPTSIASMTPSFTPAVSNGMFSKPVDQINQAGFVNELSPTPDINLSGQIVPGAQIVQAPALETVEVAEQPAVTNNPVSIPGPATTSATDQQKQAAATDAQPTSISRTTTAKATPTANDRGVMSGLFSKEALGGGVLAGLIGGPMAAPLGVLAGMTVANNGGLTGLLNSQPMTINNIGTGPQASYSVWGGAPVGTQATASDGQRITSLPGGLVGVTNSYGVTTGFDSTGKGYAVFGGGLDQDEDQDAEAAA